LPKHIGKFFPETFLILTKSSPPLRTPVALTQKLWQNQLSTAWWIELLVLRGNNNFYSTFEYFQSKIGGMTAPFALTWLRVSQQ